MIGKPEKHIEMVPGSVKNPTLLTYGRRGPWPLRARWRERASSWCCLGFCQPCCRSYFLSRTDIEWEEETLFYRQRMLQNATSRPSFRLKLIGVGLGC